MITTLLHLAERAAIGVKDVDGRVVPDRPIKSPYGYIPSLASCIVFITIYSALTLLHLAIGIRKRYWSALATMVVGGLLEILGWAGRTWSHGDPLQWPNFIMQICCLIMGPVFFSAWVYTLLGMIIHRLKGYRYSLIPANLYLVVFIVSDLVALILQAIGGGKSAVNARNYTSTKKSTRVMLAGIAFQLGMTAMFALLVLDFWVRYAWDRPYSQWSWKGLCSLCSLCRRCPFKWRKRSNDDTPKENSEDHTRSPTPEGAAASTCNSSTTAVGSDTETVGDKTSDKASDRSSDRSSYRSSYKTVDSLRQPLKPITEGESQQPYPRPAPTTEAADQVYAGAAPPAERIPICKRTKALLSGLTLATVTLVIRGIYRTIELNEGWSGKIITTQRYFVWLDGFMMAVCMLVLAVAHPGFLLPPRTWGRRWREDGVRGEGGGV